MALERYGAKRVKALHFEYAQRNSPETQCARHLAETLGVELVVVDVSAAFAAVLCSSTGTAGTLMGGAERDEEDGGEVGGEHEVIKGTPATFVPGRNLIFLHLAAALALSRQVTEVWIGVHHGSLYPDCTREALRAVEGSVREGMGFEGFEVVSPLMDEAPIAVFNLARFYGVWELAVEHTHSCYSSNSKQHEWGRGCGVCVPCMFRRWAVSTAPTPTG